MDAAASLSPALSSWTAFKLSHKQKKGMKIISNYQNRKEFPLTQIILRMILHYCKNTKHDGYK